jgi:nucleoside-diphosphate-sugar epimerase
MRRNILVTGATGKQGSALIRALLQPAQFTPSEPNSTSPEYHIYALTRKISSPTAQALHTTHSPNLTLVEGDLDDPSSIAAVFETSKLNDGGIWGVFAVLAFPGLGVSAEGEERQGKMLADIAFEYGVEAYVYSSAMRAGPKYEDQLDWKPSGKAKRDIEEHCRVLGERGLKWT